MTTSVDFMATVEFVSAVPESMRSDVELLFFFNPRQGLLVDQIRAAAERYGVPQIRDKAGFVRISVPENDMQCLFAMDRSADPVRLAAVVLYLRTASDCISVTHLAVSEGYGHGSEGFAAGLGGRMIEEVRRIARRVNGVQRIELPYQAGRYLRVHR